MLPSPPVQTNRVSKIWTFFARVRCSSDYAFRYKLPPKITFLYLLLFSRHALSIIPIPNIRESRHLK